MKVIWMLEGVGPKLLIIGVVGLVIVIIGVGFSTDFFSFQKTDKNLVIRAVGDVSTTPKDFVGKNITVSGYFYHDDLPAGLGYITSQPIQLPIVEGSLNNVDFLIMNYSGYYDSIGEGVLYYFTGLFQTSSGVTYPGSSYSLVLKSIREPW